MVLAPLLFTLYTSHFCYNSELCHIQKFAGCIRDDREEQYRSLVRDFAFWCRTNHLMFNTSKTKELVIDFGQSRPRPRLVQIEVVEVEAGDSSKYLWLWPDNKLDWTSNTNYLYRKGQRRLHFLRRLRSLSIRRKLLWMLKDQVCWPCGRHEARLFGDSHDANHQNNKKQRPLIPKCRTIRFKNS